MRMLLGLGMSLLIAVGAYLSFATRPHPSFAETRIMPERFSAVGMARAGQRLVAVGELGHILISDDEGKQWTNAKIKDNRGSSLNQVVFFNDKEGVAVGHDAWALVTEDGGLNWRETLFDKEFSEPLLGTWGTTEGPVFTFGSFGRFFVSNDHGRTWAKQDTGVGDKHIYAMDGAKDGRLMLVGEHGLAAKSTDFGATWQVIPEFYRGTMFGIVRLSDDEWLAYGLRGNVYLSKDFGATWQQIQTHQSIGLFGHAVLEDGRILIVGQGGVVIESRDRGNSFTTLQQDKGANMTAILPLSGGRLLTASLGGIKPLEIAAAKQGETK